MEVIIFIGLVAVGLVIFYQWNNKDIPSDVVKTDQGESKVETPSTTPWHTAPPEGTKPLPIPNPLDVNNDGKVNMEDVKAVVSKTKARVTKAVDANGDGKVSKADVGAAVSKAKAKVQTAAKKTAAAKKPVAKKKSA